MKVGSLVKCIQDFPDSRNLGFNVPVKSDIYTVRGFVTLGGRLGVYLEEVVNQPMIDGIEPAWHLPGFVEVLPPLDITALIEECKTETV